MNKERLIVVGNGMVALRLLQALVRGGSGRFDITVLGAEVDPAYNRILLSQVVSGEATPADLRMAEYAWYEQNGIRLLTGTTVTEIDRLGRTVATAAGARIPYDAMVIATGSVPIILPIPGVRLPGVFPFRDLGGTARILRQARPGSRAVVIGGGLLGLEIAGGLSKRGLHVTVVHLMDTLMERQLDPTAGGLVRRALERLGVRFVMPAQTAAIVGSNCVNAVQLESGERLDADLVVMAVGIRPNKTLAEQSGLACRQGILVDDALTTSDARIHAVGECAEHRGRTYGLVAPLYEQAEVCARILCGDGGAHYDGALLATSLKVSGVDVYSAGEFSDDAGGVLFYRDLARGFYRRLTVRSARLVGAVLCGETRDGPWYGDLIRNRVDVGPIRDQLVFGSACVQTAELSGAGLAMPGQSLPSTLLAEATP